MFENYRLVRAGTCTSVSLPLLPIKEGVHWITSVDLLDRLSGQRFVLNKALLLNVQNRSIK